MKFKVFMWLTLVLIFRRIRKISESGYNGYKRRHVCLPVRQSVSPPETAQLPL